MVWRRKATNKEQWDENKWMHWPAVWFGILEKGFGGSAGGCLWYSGGLAGLSWKSPGYVTDFLVGRAKVDFIEGSWEQSPLSIEDLNSTVAKYRRGKKTGAKNQIELPQKTVQKELNLNSVSWVWRQWGGGDSDSWERWTTQDPFISTDQTGQHCRLRSSLMELFLFLFLTSFAMLSWLMAFAWSHFRADSAIHNAARTFPTNNALLSRAFSW